MSTALPAHLTPFAPPRPSGALPPGVDGQWPVAPAEEVHGTDHSKLARVLYWLARATLALLARAPDGLLGPMLGVFARLARRFDHRHTRAARQFLAQAYPADSHGAREERVLVAYRHFLDVVVTSARLAARPPGSLWIPDVEVVVDREVTPPGDLEAYFAATGGRIAVTAHLGDWELGSAVLPWVGLGPVYAIGKPPRNQFLSRHMLRTREARGIRVLARRGAMAEAPAVIASGGTLALLLDQRARMKPVLAPFFGRPARCDRSAGVLVKRLKAPVLLAYCLRIPGPERRYRLECGPVFWPEQVSRWNPEEFAARINAAFERKIRQYPEQYFWLHDRYRDTPVETQAVPESTEPHR